MAKLALSLVLLALLSLGCAAQSTTCTSSYARCCRQNGRPTRTKGKMVNTSNQRIGAVSFCFVGLANAPTYGLTRVRFNGRGRKINTGLAVELGTFGSASGADGALTLAQTGNFTPVGPDPVPEIPAGQTPPSGPQLNTPSIPVVVAYVALVTRDNFWNRVVITSVPGPAIRMSCSGPQCP